MFSWFRRLFQGLFGIECQPPPTQPPLSYQAPPLSAPASADTDWVKTWLSADTTDDEAAMTPDAPPRYAYALRDDFLSFAEASFFRVLRIAVGEDFLIFPKVRLADLVFAPKQDAQYGAWQKINRKHVDFVLSDAATLRPRLVIELDDRSHRRANRIERDDFVDGIFAAVGLPILRVPVGYAYATTQLAALIDDALQVFDHRGAGSQATVPSSGLDQQRPTCGRCGGEMLLRTAAQGKHSGEQFWGCVNYPQCRSIVPLGKVPLAITGD